MSFSWPCNKPFCDTFQTLMQFINLLTVTKTCISAENAMICSKSQSSVSFSIHKSRWIFVLNIRLFLSDFSELQVTESELLWLKRKCPYFKPNYLDYLSAFRFKPEQVSVNFIEKLDNPKYGRLEIMATGPWVETIFWEVPLMACLSETYFCTVDTDWNFDGQESMHCLYMRSEIRLFKFINQKMPI